MADCLNVASLNNWVYAGMQRCVAPTVPVTQDQCRSCRGCTQQNVVDGNCQISSNNVVVYDPTSSTFPCDPEGGVIQENGSVYPVNFNTTIYINSPSQLVTFLCAFTCVLSQLSRARVCAHHRC